MGEFTDPIVSKFMWNASKYTLHFRLQFMVVMFLKKKTHHNVINNFLVFICLSMATYFIS